MKSLISFSEKSYMMRRSLISFIEKSWLSFKGTVIVFFEDLNEIPYCVFRKIISKF